MSFFNKMCNARFQQHSPQRLKTIVSPSGHRIRPFPEGRQARRKRRRASVSTGYHSDDTAPLDGSLPSSGPQTYWISVVVFELAPIFWNQKNIHCVKQWWIQDFPEGCQHNKWFFCQNCSKIGPRREGAFPAFHLPPPMHLPLLVAAFSINVTSEQRRNYCNITTRQCPTPRPETAYFVS